MESRRDQVGVVSNFGAGQGAGRNEQVVRALQDRERSGTVLGEFWREGDARAQGSTDASLRGIATGRAARSAGTRLEQVVAILRAAKEMGERRQTRGGYRTHHHAIFALIAATGLRKGEASALQWADVDFQRGTLSVRGSLSRVQGQWVITAPRTKSSRRVLVPSAGVLDLLEQHRRIQADERRHAASAGTEGSFVFTTATGAPLDPGSVLRAFTTAAEQAGTSGVSIHTLRHSAATAMLDAGVHLKAVSDLLGHAGTQITADVYAHLTTPTARKALSDLGSGLGLDSQLAYGVGVRHQEGPTRESGSSL